MSDGNPVDSLTQYRFDLGVRSLVKEWKQLLTWNYLKDDLLAGATVACTAIPLSLAIALASGVSPDVGLTTAIVAGLVCALFGGTKLAVTGPAAAMAILVSSTVQQFGLAGLLIAGLGCGLLQLATGILGLGQLVHFLPIPVISGFTAGIGAIIFIGQLPGALGLPAPDQSHVLGVILHIGSLLHQIHYVALFLSFGTMIIALFLPKFFPRLPAALIAVLVTSGTVGLLGVEVPSIGIIPSSLLPPKLPQFSEFPASGYGSLMWATFMIYALASLETLLSATSLDKMARTQRHNPDQELIGQGLGNIVSALFGGIPVTSVIARSALNVQAGAKTRRAAFIHSLLLLLAVYYFSTPISHIPRAVLSGILFSVAFRMLNVREFLQIWRNSRLEAVTYLITFMVIVSVDLIVGVQAGIVSALVITALRFGRIQGTVYSFDREGPTLISLNGTLTFLASRKMKAIQAEVDALRPMFGVVIDLSRVRSMDASGCGLLIELIEHLMGRGVKCAVKGMSKECQASLFSLEHGKAVSPLLALSESDVHRILDQPGGSSGFNRVMYGVERFRKEVKSHYEPLFESLRSSQAPHTLFITCSDSRINPNLITSTDPGELFIVRNVGNIIPCCGTDATPAEGAAIEYALGVLGVSEIIICAHSGCGAMNTVMAGELFEPKNADKMPNVAMWLKQVEQLRGKISSDSTPNHLAELNVRLQVENIKTYPIVQQMLKENRLQIHAWFYDIGLSELDEWDENQQEFIPIDRTKRKVVYSESGSK